MSTVLGQGTTYNLPNFVGELFGASPEDTPFLSAIGGLTGGRRATGTVHTWSGYDLRDAVANRSRVEGANAPQAEARARFSASNVLEIHQEALDLSYTKLAAVGQVQGPGIANPAADAVLGSNAVADELTWQRLQALKQVARDIEASFVTGVKVDPSDNTDARQTAGIIAATTTNVVDLDGEAATRDDIDDLMQAIYLAGGISESATAAIMVSPVQKRRLTKIYVTDAGYAEGTRNVGGVSVTTIHTDFGALNVLLNRYMPSDVIQVVSLEECAPVFLEIPGKGFLFAEPLAQTGASVREQIYCEVGLEYGNERKHGKLINVGTGTPVEDPEDPEEPGDD